MKKSILFFAALIYSSVNLFLISSANAQSYLWAKSAGGNNNNHWGNSVTADASGNIIVTGTFNTSSITFGTATLTTAGFGDIFIVKYDGSGNVLWAKSAGGTNDDWGSSVTADASGNIIVTGYFWSSSITFGTTTLTNANAGGGFDNIFVVKLNGTVTGIEENEQAGGTIFPNPTSGEFQIQMAGGNCSQCKVEIYNVMGEKVGNWQLAVGKNEIDLSNQPKGLYFWRVAAGSQNASGKIVIE